MNTETDRINNLIEELHRANITLVRERKYTEIQLNLEKIKVYQDELSHISKVDDLTKLMLFLNKEIPTVQIPSFEDNMHRAYNGMSTCTSTIAAVDKRVFKAMFEAIVELNRKVEALTPKSELIKCKCCKGFGNDLVQENGYCRHCQSS
jgi:hypothetical protein